LAFPGAQTAWNNADTLVYRFTLQVLNVFAAQGLTGLVGFTWEAQNSFSYLNADQTTVEFLKWMYENGQFATQFSAVARYHEADYATFRDDKHKLSCVGFRRMGKPQRGGYESLTGAIMCAPPGKTLANDDISQKPLLFVRFKGKKHLGMAHGDSALLEKRLGVGLEIQKPHGIGYRRAAFSDSLGDLVLGLANRRSNSPGPVQRHRHWLVGIPQL
jgi:hypothetical protein